VSHPCAFLLEIPHRREPGRHGHGVSPVSRDSGGTRAFPSREIQQGQALADVIGTVLSEAFPQSASVDRRRGLNGGTWRGARDSVLPGRALSSLL